MSEQYCQICGVSVAPNVRYRDYICFEWCNKSVDENGRKLGFVTDRFQVLLRDFEQHALEVMRHKCGDGRKQRAERLDQSFRLFVVGQISD